MFGQARRHAWPFSFSRCAACTGLSNRRGHSGCGLRPGVGHLTSVSKLWPKFIAFVAHRASEGEGAEGGLLAAAANRKKQQLERRRGKRQRRDREKKVTEEWTKLLTRTGRWKTNSCSSTGLATMRIWTFTCPSNAPPQVVASRLSRLFPASSSASGPHEWLPVATSAPPAPERAATIMGRPAYIPLEPEFPGPRVPRLQPSQLPVGAVQRDQWEAMVSVRKIQKWRLPIFLLQPS